VAAFGACAGPFFGQFDDIVAEALYWSKEFEQSMYIFRWLGLHNRVLSGKMTVTLSTHEDAA